MIALSRDSVNGSEGHHCLGASNFVEPGRGPETPSSHGTCHSAVLADPTERGWY